LAHNIISRILVRHLVINNLFHTILVLLCAAFFRILAHISHTSVRFNNNVILLQTKICLERILLWSCIFNVIPYRIILGNNIKYITLFRLFISHRIKNRPFQ
jgi:hypothetical protein